MIRSELGRNLADLESKPSGYFPGLTTLLSGSLGFLGKFVLRAFMYPTPQGALTQLWAGTSPDTADLNGAVSRYSLPTPDEANAVACSISAHGHELEHLVATIQSLGEISGFGSKSRLRISDHPHLRCPPYFVESVLYTLCPRRPVYHPINETTNGMDPKKTGLL